MKIKCIGTEITDEIANQFKVSRASRGNFDLKIDNIYKVYSVITLLDNNYYGACSEFEIEDDAGRLCSVPAYLFEVVDPMPSLGWVGIIDKGFVQFSYPELRIKYFTEDLFDEEPEAVRVWSELRARYKNSKYE
jgi:hypothetical protein